MSEYKLSFAIVVDNKEKKYNLVRVESKVPWEALLEKFPERDIVMEAYYFSTIKAMDDFERYKRAVRKINMREISLAELCTHFENIPDEFVFYKRHIKN